VLKVFERVPHVIFNSYAKMLANHSSGRLHYSFKADTVKQRVQIRGLKSD